MPNPANCPNCKYPDPLDPSADIPICPSCGWEPRWKPVHLPPVPETEDDFREGLRECYRRKHGAGMEYLRLVWEVGGWLSNALDNAKSNGWPVGEIVREIQESGHFWKGRSTIYAYAQLGRERWGIVAKSGASVRKALADMRNRNRTPGERAAMKARRGEKDREIESLARMVLDRDNEIADLTDAVAAHAEAEQLAVSRADALEAALGRCPSCRALVNQPLRKVG